jgi:hypothetical protein
VSETPTVTALLIDRSLGNRGCVAHIFLYLHRTPTGGANSCTEADGGLQKNFGPSNHPATRAMVQDVAAMLRLNDVL